MESQNNIKHVVGSDATYNIDDILKFTNSEVIYDKEDPIPTVEVLPVEGAFLVHNLASPQECKQYITLGEEMDFGRSPLHNTALGSTSAIYSDDARLIRNSDRVLFDVPDQIGSVLNRRILPFLPKTIELNGNTWHVQVPGGGKAKGPINKRWRFNRYSQGQYFKPHVDACYCYDENEVTLLTFILYLNEGFEGGETIFFPGNRKFGWSRPIPGIEYKIIPKTGTALIFFQVGDLNHRHEGAIHRSPNMYKYILRSDIAYFK